MLKLKTCKCGKEFKQYNSLKPYCSTLCTKLYAKPKRINKVSKKRQEDNEIYKVIRQEFLSKEYNQICFIEGCNKQANTIEHSMGRVGYADDWARENGITLFLDVRFWKPCCLEHNLELENNPELSKQYQLSKIHGGKKNKTMILKIEVDLTDIYTEYEDEASITDLIKDEIASRIKKDAYEMFSKDAKDSFTNQVVRRIELDKELKIQELLKELFSNKKIFKTNYNGEVTEMTLEEKITYELERNYNNESKFNDYFRKHFENCTAQISKELKERYDLLFASQIVAKLNEQGMLKEDVAKILLNK